MPSGLSGRTAANCRSTPSSASCGRQRGTRGRRHVVPPVVRIGVRVRDPDFARPEPERPAQVLDLGADARDPTRRDQPSLVPGAEATVVLEPPPDGVGRDARPEPRVLLGVTCTEKAESKREVRAHRHRVERPELHEQHASVHRLAEELEPELPQTLFTRDRGRPRDCAAQCPAPRAGGDRLRS